MKVLLVDDEIVVTQILRKAICWEEIGVTEVLTAFNAKEAKRLVEEEQIDIVISDIEMPQENGLSFLAWVQERQPDITNIILTGFPDFNYAKDAISIGVFKFLLKPVNYEEVKKTVQEAVLNIRKEKQKENQRKYGQYFEKNRIKAEKLFYMDLISEEILPFSNYIDRQIRSRGMNRNELELECMVLLHGRKEKVQEKEVTGFALENIAEELFPETIMFQYNTDMIWLVKQGKQTWQAELSIKSYLNKVRTYFQYEFCAYYTTGISLEEIAPKYRMLKEASQHYYKEGQRIYSGDLWQKNVMQEMNPEKEKSVAGNEWIGELQVYLEQHYNEPITRKDVESLVHMNQDYLNRSFKCATGYTLMEYLQHYRVLKAKEYLADSTYTISEIGCLVGYDSPPYFSKIFKKCTGLTPADYRGQARNKL